MLSFVGFFCNCCLFISSVQIIKYIFLMKGDLFMDGTNMFSSLTTDVAMQVLDQITALIPTVLPAVIGFIAFRKGWKFIKSALLGA